MAVVPEDFIDDIINKINRSVRETEDDFIFTTVQPYCETVTERKISKRVLIRALQCFMTEHNEEFKFLTKEREDKE